MLKSCKPEMGFEIQFDVPHPGRKDRIQLEIRPFRRFGRELEMFDEGGKTRLRLTRVDLETFAPETNPDSFPAIPRGLDGLPDLLKDFLASA